MTKTVYLSGWKTSIVNEHEYRVRERGVFNVPIHFYVANNNILS